MGRVGVAGFFTSIPGVPCLAALKNEEVDTEKKRAAGKIYWNIRLESKNTMKALFADRGHLKVNAPYYRQETLFYKVLVGPLFFPPCSFSGSTLIGLITPGAGLSIPDWLESVM